MQVSLLNYGINNGGILKIFMSKAHVGVPKRRQQQKDY